MSNELLRLLPSRRGHFRMESGYHSAHWYHLGALFSDRHRLDPFVRLLAGKLADYHPDVVCGPMTGGARLAELVATPLGCAPAHTVRIQSADATGLFPVRYLVPEPDRARLAGKRVVLVDDAISAGSAIKGSHTDLLACGAQILACGALVVFGNAAQAFCALQGLGLQSVLHAPFEMWLPEDCPLCRAGQPLEIVSET